MTQHNAHCNARINHVLDQIYEALGITESWFVQLSGWQEWSKYAASGEWQ